MTATEVHRHLQQTDPPPLLLDVRESWEFTTCRIDGSELLPMGRIPSEFSQLDPGRETIVICHHGVRSYQVAIYLERQGFSNLINLSGGVAAWAREVDPSMATY